jgi:hypothetical protein
MFMQSGEAFTDKSGFGVRSEVGGRYQVLASKCQVIGISRYQVSGVNQTIDNDK